MLHVWKLFGILLNAQETWVAAVNESMFS